MSSRWFPWLLLAAGVLVYANSLSGPFVFDDVAHLVREDSIRSLARGAEIGRHLGASQRPVLELSLALNHAIGGLEVTGYHLVNLAIHLLAGLTLFGIVRRTLQSPALRERHGRWADGLAFAVALIWLVHPLQTQAVTYVIQRGESLMGLLYLLTLYCVIRRLQAGGGGWSVAAVAACGLGMGTKAVMVTAPLLVLLYDRTFAAGSLREAFRRRWRLYLGLASTWGVLAGVVGAGALFDVKASAGFGLQTMTPLEYALTQPGVIRHYLRLAVWPHPLSLDYAWPRAAEARTVLLSALDLLGLLAVTLWGLVRRTWWGFAGAWFFGILAPTSSVMPIADVAVEHRMYLPLAAVVLAAVALGHGLRLRAGRRGPGLAVALLLAAVLPLGATTLRRNHDYRSAVAIWQATVDTTPHNPRAHYGLGLALATAGRDDGAIREYQAALELAPDYTDARINLGNQFAAQGRFDEAIAQYRRVLEVAPDEAVAHYNLARALAGHGDADEAIRRYRGALEIDPGYAKAHNNLGAALASQGDYEGAIRHYRAALKSDPDYADARRNLEQALAARGWFEKTLDGASESLPQTSEDAGLHAALADALVRRGRIDEAIVHYRRALEIAPDAATVHNNLANAMASLGRLEEAIAHYRRALELAPDDDKAHTNLGRVLAVQGRLEEALRHHRRAVELAPERASAHEHLAAALQALGRSEQALEQRREAARLAALANP